MTRYFYDCEFLEDGRTIDLVSIGIVSESGREYYAVNANVHWERMGKPEWEWVRENVWKHLPTSGPGQLSLNRYNPDVKEKWRIAQEVRDFLLGDTSNGQLPHIELWADYPAYDHVALAQLWGRMVDLPTGIPMRTNCLVQLGESLGISEKHFPQQDERTKHHALYDALHHRTVFNAIHPEAFRQQYLANEIVTPGPRRGEEGGEPVVSAMTKDKTWDGRAVSDLPHVFPEG